MERQVGYVEFNPRDFEKSIAPRKTDGIYDVTALINRLRRDTNIHFNPLDFSIGSVPANAELHYVKWNYYK